MKNSKFLLPYRIKKIGYVKTRFYLMSIIAMAVLSLSFSSCDKSEDKNIQANCTKDAANCKYLTMTTICDSVQDEFVVLDLDRTVEWKRWVNNQFVFDEVVTLGDDFESAIALDDHTLSVTFKDGEKIIFHDVKSQGNHTSFTLTSNSRGPLHAKVVFPEEIDIMSLYTNDGSYGKAVPPTFWFYAAACLFTAAVDIYQNIKCDKAKNSASELCKSKNCKPTLHTSGVECKPKNTNANDGEVGRCSRYSFWC